MAQLSNRLKSFESSKIAEIFASVARLKEQGEHIVDLSTGEPDFQTNRLVCAAAKGAIDRGVTKYTAIDGMTELKKAIQKKFMRDNQLAYELDEIIVDSGAKPLLTHTFLAILSEGDEVIIPTPCWPSHPGAVRLCGASAVFVRGQEENGFKLDPDELEGAITSRTKAVILNSPSNPTGAIYSMEELKKLIEILKKYPQVWIVADDIYEKIRYDGRDVLTIAQVSPELKDRTVTINGLSKGYAMTGWRIGFAGGPRRLMDAIRQIMSQAAGNPCSISQVAAIAALEGDQQYVSEQAEIYQARRDRMVYCINQAMGLTVRPCQGAFYLYVNCQGVLGKNTKEGQCIQTSTDFVKYLLENYKVAVVPGITFECEPYFRLSFATSEAELEIAGERMMLACQALS